MINKKKIMIREKKWTQKGFWKFDVTLRLKYLNGNLVLL